MSMANMAPAGPNARNTGGAQDHFYGPAATVPLPYMVRSEGIYFWDEAGNRYLDASSGPVVSNLGHGNRHVIAAMTEQATRLAFSYCRQTRTRINESFAAMLAGMAGPGFERVNLVSGGSEAMDLALKFCRQLAWIRGEPERTKIVSCMPSYHGGTIATLAASGDPTVQHIYRDMAPAVVPAPAPLSFRVPQGHSQESWAHHCAAELEAAILRAGPETVLAFLLEPVGGLATGANVPHPAYFRAIREICTRHGVLVVFDEVMSGAGRTGRFLAAHHWPDALPDVLVLAKGIGAGYAPLGAMLAPDRLVEELRGAGGFNYGHTYNANPVACAVGQAVLEEISAGNLIAAAADRGVQLRDETTRSLADNPLFGDMRGLGLLQAVEVVADRATASPFPPEFAAPDRIRAAGLRHGLLIYLRRTSGGRFGDWVMLSPPLTTTADQITELVGAFRRTLDDVAAQALAEGFI